MATTTHRLDLATLGLGRLRVLAVVADRFQLGWLQGLLDGEQPSGRVVIEECRSPVDALEQGERGEFDLCFLDDRFGERAVLRYLYTLRAWSHPFPTILLTAPENEALVARAFEAGVADYVVRGAETQQLVQRSVRYAIESHRQTRESRLLNDRYRALFERTHAGAYQLTSDGTIVRCNYALAQMLGYPNKEALFGKPMLGVDPESAAPAVPLGREPQWRAFLGHEVCLQRADGSPLWVRMSDILVGEEGGRQLFEGTLVDVSRARQLEDLLRQREAQYLGLFDAIAEGMLILNDEGKVVACNRRAEIQLGVEIQDLLGRPFGGCFADLFGDGYRRLREQEVAPLRTLATGESVASTVVGFRRHDGREGWASLRTTPVPVPGGSTRRSVIVTLTDLTQQKTLEAQLIRAQKMEVLGRLAGGMAHEFRNLLTAISGYNELLVSDGELSENGRMSTDEIRRASKRAASLASQMLNFARRDELAVQAVDVDELLSHLQYMLKRLLGGSIRLLVDLNSGGARVTGDPGQLEQVILNLVINARDAMPNGGNLRLGTQQLELAAETEADDIELCPGRYVVLAVEDDGAGMDEATRRRAFEPFFTTKGPGKGTGLGLPMVREIVRGYGGDVWLKSESGRGASVKIFLPAAEEAG